MKADRTRDFEEGPERDALREALRRWPVPPVPEELETALRFELRMRRAKPRRVLWLSLAAGLALLAAWPLVFPRPGAERRAASAARPRAPVQAPPVARVEAAQATIAEVVPLRPTARPSPARTAAGARAARRGVSPPSIVVEPGQAELLAEFGRTAWERTEAAPGASIPAMPAVRTPAFRAEWQEIAGEWPAVQVAVSESGR
jgi:hypothetical protein